MRTLAQILVLSLTLPASRALAGIADSPLPVLEAGKTTLHLYSVSGVVHVGGPETFFSCTSTDTLAMRVGVELLGSVGGSPCNDAAAESLPVNPGQEVVFGTSNALWTSVDSHLSFCTSRGSARILATSKKLVCTAYLADPGNYPPTSMVHLTIVRKLTEKGE